MNRSSEPHSHHESRHNQRSAEDAGFAVLFHAGCHRSGTSDPGRSANGAIPLAEGSEISDLAIRSVRAGNMPAFRPRWMPRKA